MIIFSLVAMTGLEKCCITSAYLQWQCHSGERLVARGPLVVFLAFNMPNQNHNLFNEKKKCIYKINIRGVGGDHQNDISLYSLTGILGRVFLGKNQY